METKTTFLSVDSFYAARPERARSGEVDFGVMWVDAGTRWPCYRVSWIIDTGEFYAVRLGGVLVGEVELLGAVLPGDRLAAEEAMSGWALHDRNELEWVRRRLT